MPDAIPVSARPILDQHTMHHALNRMDTLLAMRLEGLHRMTNLSCVKWKRKLHSAGRLISHADQVGRGHYLMCLPAIQIWPVAPSEVCLLQPMNHTRVV